MEKKKKIYGGWIGIWKLKGGFERKVKITTACQTPDWTLYKENCKAREVAL